MAEGDGRFAGGVVLVIAGLWLGLQAVVGDLAGRLLSYAKPACEGPSCDDAAASGDVAQARKCCATCPNKTILWLGDVIPCRDFLRLVGNDPGRA